ncbi:MAG: DUF3800 domain-containing protein [Symploca sp. SIO1B1]|nr:DUF3800 domain-containing protein [Symploca sp. SIO2D2]NER46179.1 DUF3800 domain-containing protein [Symploca sp. SIO1A3]NES00281.1 DUF3800 domain-containing protein [Symploca sp. SIO1B1]
MILFYIDESGTGWRDKETNFFFLVSFAAPVQQWLQIDREFLSFKRSVRPNSKPEEWELKGREIWQGVGKFKKVKREYRIRDFLQLAEILSNLPCHIFAVQVNKTRLRDSDQNIKDDNDLYQFAFKQMLEELNAFIKDSHENGILFMDSRSTQNTSVQDNRVIRAYRDWEGEQTESSRFVDLPWFGFSEFYTGLQLADYVAYLISRRPSDEGAISTSRIKLLEAFNVLQAKIHLFEFPQVKKGV